MNRDRFCLIPFTSIVYRPDGKIITCSQGKAPIGPRHRLDEWPADKIWNSVFMKQFRMAKMNNEYVDETQHQTAFLQLDNQNLEFQRHKYNHQDIDQIIVQRKS